MRLKPSTPYIELTLPIILTFFFVRTILLGLERNDGLIISGGLIFLLIAIGTIFWINRNYKTVNIGESITISGFFWGQLTLEIKELKSYKLKEVRRTKHAIKDFDLILIDKADKERLTITQGEYKTADWDNFVNELTKLKLDFLGQENLLDQVTNIWSSFKQRFVR